ncbi:hypothetical protein DSM112329_04433 [Paraconexibacter sp. AEG42_29]|uniref:ER-bound oxygenase mpaB/mpaB'/Rubber oxygenase catalytic domain-containing protein n=1 Tax=Paraconexibacter sp. AEG42_29 TaxID=2997339 RepID=A0AAU7B0Z0_9ACTN
MASILPPPDEYAALAPRPGSPVAVAFNDVRALSAAGYATLLQVAHPTVGAGVHQYSSFVKDPWGRLLRTLDYVHGTVSGGPELAGTIGKRVREMHRTIRGHRGDGVAYSAMEPDAFAWVHATLASSIVDGHRQFARPMTDTQAEAFWAQWIDVGKLIGVRPRDLPATWRDFRPYFDRVVREELTWTPAVPELLETLDRPAPPAIPGLHPALWSVMRRPMALQLRIATVGMLPPDLRPRLGVSLTRSEETAFRVLSAASRAATPLIRGPLGEFGPTYVKYRRAALERGDVAAATPAAKLAA